MSNKSKWLRLILVVFSFVPILGCISLSYFIDIDANGSGAGVVYHTLTFPDFSDSGESPASLFDSYIQNLSSEGWENIEIGSSGGDTFQITAIYHFDLAAARNLPESMRNMAITVEEGENGEKKFVFNGTYDYSEFLVTWNEMKSGQSYDFGPWLGGEQLVMTEEEIDYYLEQYGEPVFETKIRMPGNTPLSANGWSNSDDFLNGETDTLIFSWTPGMSTTGILTASSQINPVTTTEQPASTEELVDQPYVDDALVGMPCEDYCISQDPIGFWVEGENYPDCKCDCGEGNLFLQLKCISYMDLCPGEGMRMITDKDRPGVCMCTDPTKKYDVATRKCIDLDGTECNHGNGCEPDYGENCQNCSDCGCSFGSGENSQYNQYLSCNPNGANADIYGCVFEMPEKTEQLEIMKEEWTQCRDAWALMNLAGGYGQTGYHSEVMGAIGDLPKVQKWQEKSGCIPTAGVVLGREAVDPLICLIRYCDRINTSIHEMEQQILQEAPVIHGPSIKINPPNAIVTIGALQVPQFTGQVSLYGDRSNSLMTTFGAGFVESQYEIVNNPDTGMTIYLYDGSFTYTYYDEGSYSIKQEVLRSSEMLSVDLAGIPISREVFIPAERETWWEGTEYLVNCPPNSTQKGPDCFCNSGYDMNIELEQCLPGDEPASESADQQPTNTATRSEGASFQQLLPLVIYYSLLILIVIVAAIILIIRNKKKVS